MIQLINLLNISPIEYAEALENKAISCDRTDDEYVRKEIPIESLSESTCHSKRTF